MTLGAIADDVTGGTDLASVLRRVGCSVVQTIGVPRGSLPPADAVVVSLKTRTAPASLAVSATRAAADFLIAEGANQLYFKYCSTFDSTDDGNIGPVIEALLDRLDAQFAIACPAYPALGRTIYSGHLFVGDQLLSDSPMRHHPLTPMTDANLLRVLRRQSSLPIGLVPLASVDAGSAAVMAQLNVLGARGTRIAIGDAVLDRHVGVLAEAAAGMRLVTGSAALGGALGRAHRAAPPKASNRVPDFTPRAPVAILSGSCSAATRAQLAQIASRISTLTLDPLALAQDGRTLNHAIGWAREHIRRGTILLSSSANPENVRRAQARLGRDHAARLLDHAFGQIAAELVSEGVSTFIVAGGETSGSVLDALDIRVLRFGREISPGVTWCQSIEPQGFSLALKSGNFGSVDFFLRAVGMVE